MQKSIIRTVSLIIGISVGLQPIALYADMASDATSPVAPLIQLRFQDQFIPDSRNATGYSNAGIVQAVIPIKLPSDWMPSMITRTTTPYVSTPELPGIGRQNGLGDTVFLGFGIPKWQPLENTILAVGPALTIPTAGDNDFTGEGKWQAGPAAVYFNHGKPGRTYQFGLMAYQQWSYASARSNSEHVSKLQLQPIFTKHFKGGWCVGTPDTPNAYNFETSEWALNLGMQVGRVFHIGKQGVQLYGGAYYNTEETNGITAKMTYKISFGFLFPE